MKNTKKKVGIKDIAAKAGVSIGTVDRVLHKRGEVKEETRQKVLDIVEELGYTPNIFAKSLSSKKTIRIAIVIPDSSDDNPYWEKPVKGIKVASEELASYNTEIIYEHFDASDEKSFQQILDRVLNANVNGVVLNPVFKSTSLAFLQELDQQEIPYVFIDVNLKEVNNLAYFGQDAEQSGRVAATLMARSIPANPYVLIVKQTNRMVFSRHIESRIVGFFDYFHSVALGRNLKTTTVEIDLLQAGEPKASLDQIFQEHPEINGVFIPNSRGFKLAEYLEQTGHKKDLITIGYDLVDPNVAYLNKGYLSYLISQKPEEQAHKAIWALFNYLVSQKEVEKTNYSSIDIILKENIEYYHKNELKK